MFCCLWQLPIFLERLEVTHLDLGDSVPIIQRASRPQLDSRGVWVDLDVVYEGGFTMTIDTKVNLLRIKQMQAESPNSESPKNGSPAKCPSPTPLWVAPAYHTIMAMCSLGYYCNTMKCVGPWENFLTIYCERIFTPISVKLLIRSSQHRPLVGYTHS